jgi:hypothetical protein
MMEIDQNPTGQTVAATDPYSGKKVQSVQPFISAQMPMLVMISLIALGLLFAGQYFFVTTFWKTPAQVAAVAPEVIQFQYTPRTLRSAYLMANGGIDNLRSLRVLRATGYNVTEQQRQEFVMIRHYPNLGRFTYRTGEDTQVVFTVGEEDVWMTLFLGDDGIHDVDVEPEQTEQLRVMARFFSPLMRWALDEEGQVLGIDNNVIYNGRPAVLVRLAHADLSQPSHFFMDPDTLRTLGRRDFSATGELLREQVYLDHRQVRGTSQPFKVITRTDGMPDSMVEFEQIAFNVPVLTGIFSRGAAVAPALSESEDTESNGGE